MTQDLWEALHSARLTHLGPACAEADDAVQSNPEARAMRFRAGCVAAMLPVNEGVPIVCWFGLVCVWCVNQADKYVSRPAA